MPITTNRKSITWSLYEISNLYASRILRFVVMWNLKFNLTLWKIQGRICRNNCAGWLPKYYQRRLVECIEMLKLVKCVTDDVQKLSKSKWRISIIDKTHKYVATMWWDVLPVNVNWHLSWSNLTALPVQLTNSKHLRYHTNF